MSGNRTIRLLALPAVVLAFGTAALAAKPKTVDTPKQAVAIGMKVCDQSWGAFKRRQGEHWKLDPKQWNARLDGDRWFVWMGDEKKPSMHIKIARDGTPPNARSDCLLTLRE